MDVSLCPQALWACEKQELRESELESSLAPAGPGCIFRYVPERHALACELEPYENLVGPDRYKWLSAASCLNQVGWKSSVNPAYTWH